jgi:hypothetical protein
MIAFRWDTKKESPTATNPLSRSRPSEAIEAILDLPSRGGRRGSGVWYHTSLGFPDIPDSATGSRILQARRWPGRHVGFLENQLADLLPVAPRFALFADRGHIVARVLNCAQGTAVLSRDRAD